MATRTDGLSTRINPKVKYLAELRAREQCISLSRLVELSLEAALSQGTSHMCNEGLWDEDPAKRLYMLVTAQPDLMNETERQLWRRIRSMPELLNKSGAVDRHKLSANWSAVIGTGKV